MLIDSDVPGYDFSGYGAILMNQLRRHWRPPSVRPPEMKDHAAHASFIIHKDGSITDIQIAISSGWPLMDQTVREGIQRAMPAPSLPPTYSAGSIRVRVRFVLPFNP